MGAGTFTDTFHCTAALALAVKPAAAAIDAQRLRASRLGRSFMLKAFL
jgi:hypothetical protein